MPKGATARWLAAAVLVFAAVAAWAAWRCWGAGPRLLIKQGEYGPEVANVFLGEYCLDLDWVSVSDDQGVEVVVANRRADPRSKLPHSVPFFASADLRPALEAAGWRVTTPSSGHIRIGEGRRYQLRVRGNNGFGYANETRCVVTVSTTPGLECGIL